MKKEIINLAGYFVGDGYWLDGKPSFSTTSQYLAEKYSNLLRKLQVKCTKYIRRKRRKNWKPEIIIVCDKKFGNVISEVIQKLDLLVKQKTEAEMFLRGIFDAEGTISFSSTRRGREIKISNTDERVIKLVMSSLRTLHIKFSYRVLSNRKNRKDLYEIRIYGPNSLKFIQQVKPFKLQDKVYLKERKINLKYKKLIVKILHPSAEPKPKVAGSNPAGGVNKIILNETAET